MVALLAVATAAVPTTTMLTDLMSTCGGRDGHHRRRKGGNCEGDGGAVAQENRSTMISGKEDDWDTKQSNNKWEGSGDIDCDCGGGKQRQCQWQRRKWQRRMGSRSTLPLCF